MKKVNKSLRFSSVVEKSRSKLWGHQIRVPKRIFDAVISGSSRRVWCSLNGAPEYQCALVPIGGGSYVITVNKLLQRKLNARPGTPVSATVRRDDSKYGLPMPEEFREVLKQDREGNRLFHALSSGRQRTLLYIIGKGKDSDQKIARGIIIVRHLKKNGGKINYRGLGEEMKRK